MCILFKKNKPLPPNTVQWPTYGGPSDSDYEKTSLEYQMQKNKNKEAQTSFSDDSSMTP